MMYGPEKHYRHSIRLKEYDYSQAGAYFVTTCTKNKECLFGDAEADLRVCPNDAGKMIDKWWMELVNKYPSIETDKHVVMPNHFHGIIFVVLGRPCVVALKQWAKNKGNHIGLPLQMHNIEKVVYGEKK